MIGYEFSNLKKFKGLKCFVTDRNGGTSNPPYNSLNLGFHTADKHENILKNRLLVSDLLGHDIKDFTFMNLMHGSNVKVVENEDRGKGSVNVQASVPDTDAMITKEKGAVLSVLTADCIPAVVYDPKLHIIAVLHGG